LGSSPKVISELTNATGLIARLAYRNLLEARIDPQTLLTKAGLTSTEIEDAHIRLKVQKQISFLNLAADALEDDFLGFHLAEHCELREIGLLYYVLASSENLPDALQRAVRYSSIVNDGVSLRYIGRLPVGLSLHYTGVSRHIDKHQIEFWITVIIRICRQLTGTLLLPNRVKFSHFRESYPKKFSALLGCDVEFAAMTDEVVFSPENKKLSVVSSDPYLNKLLVEYCEEALSRRHGESRPFRVAVENALAPLLPHGNAKAERVARKLGMSRRTLARQLAKEGISFSDLLERLRASLALRYLAEEGLSVSQIAWLLGYQEVGAFSHAFKRWTGKTPRQARVGK
jgi:AraC-like DNA-binding protein